MRFRLNFGAINTPCLAILLLVSGISDSALGGPTTYRFAAGACSNDVQLEFSGARYNVLEARLGESIHRETFKDFPLFPCHGKIYFAPQQVGGFVLMDRRSPGMLRIGAWKESTGVERPRKPIVVSPQSDAAHLPFQVTSGEPIEVHWLSGTTLRISQHFPNRSGDDKDEVRVIRFDAQSGTWFQIWPDPGATTAITADPTP